MAYEKLPIRTSSNIDASADVNLLQANFDAIIGGDFPNGTINNIVIYLTEIPELWNAIAIETAIRTSSTGLINDRIDLEIGIRETSTGLLNDRIDLCIPLAEKAVPFGVATLTSTGKIPASQIPPFALTETFVVSSESEMLNLTDAEIGDLAIRTDLTETFVLAEDPYSVLANWILIEYRDLTTKKFIVQTSDIAVPNAQALAELSNGVLINTTSTGILSVADTTGTGKVVFDTAPTISDITLSDLNRSFTTYGLDTKMFTGVPADERFKFKITVTYDAPNVKVSLSFTGANTSFSYYINGKKYTVTDLTAFTNKTETAAEGTWFVYINSSNVFTLTQSAWTINNPDVLLWNFYFNATANTITWIGEERHTAGRDIFQHARNHTQGALYKSGFAFSQYNSLTALSTNTDNNFGRAMTTFTGGSFYDEDILNNIIHADTALTSTTASPSTDWNLNVSQFLGFTALATTLTSATQIVFTTSRTLATGQGFVCMAGNTTTVRGTGTITTGATGTTFATSSVTNMQSGDAIIVSAKIPIYYITSSSPYIWRKLASSSFLGVTAGAAITESTITSATAQYNSSTGGFTDITSTGYYPVYIMATNMTSEPLIAVLGQGQSIGTSLTTALSEYAFQFQNLVGLSSLNIQEVAPIYRLTFQYSPAADFNASRIRLVDQTFVNVRVSTATGIVNNPAVTTLPASAITVDTTNFNGILSSIESTVQSALDMIDDSVASANISGGMLSTFMLMGA